MKNNKTKIEINKALDNLSEDLLGSVLAYIKNIESMNAEKISMKKHLNEIILTDNDLLRKLSQ